MGQPALADSRSLPASALAVAALYLLAFLSGAAALVYEITWAKMLALTFGSTTLSATAVIAGFMGGMGIGARMYQLVNERTSRPLVLYALLEIGIAASAALLTLLFYSLPELFAEVSHLVPAGLWLGLLRFAAVFALLLIPAALMGATFPALCTVMIRTAGAVDRHLGMIYGINTIGGAAGVLLGGLVLIERLGLTGSVRVANLVNLLIGGAALALLGTALGRRGGPAGEGGGTAIPTRLSQKVTGVVLLLSGFTTLSYEILWFRALRFLVGNSTHALGTVLIIFLLGLGAGSLLLRRVVARRSPESDLALCQFFIAALALWAMVCESMVLAHPAVYEHVSIFLPEVRLQPWGWRMAVIAAVSVVTMLPAALCMGLSFPLASRLFIGDVRRLGTRVGGAYLLANLGSILGAVAAAVLLLPVFGVTGGTRICAFLNLGLGLLVLTSIRRHATKPMLDAVFAILVVVMLSLALPSNLGLYGEAESGRLAFVEDADQGTVQVLDSPTDPTKQLMLVDGCKIGCSFGYPDSPMHFKQVMLAHLPMVLDAGIENTLNIGLGSASTLQTLATYPNLKTLDCVEINPAVVRGSRLFAESAVLDEPRVDLVVDDAVHYLLRSGREYDLIISDGKQDPFFSGNATLLCREYYRYARDRLTDDGLFVQWTSLGTLSSDFQVILRTVCEVFPNVEVFVLAPDAVFMVASTKPVFGRTGMSEDRAARLGACPTLTRFGIDTPAATAALRVAGRDQLMAVLGEGPISTWDHLVLDYSPFKADPNVWRRSKLDNLRLLLAAEGRPRRDSAPVPDFAHDLFVQSARLIREAYTELFAGNAAAAIRLAERAVQVNPADRAAGAALAAMRREADAASPP